MQTQPAATLPTKASVDKIAALTRREKELSTRRAKFDALMEAEEQRAQEAEAKALELFGTADLDALRARFTEDQALFDAAWFEFEVELDQYEATLTQAETALKAV